MPRLNIRSQVNARTVTQDAAAVSLSVKDIPIGEISIIDNDNIICVVRDITDRIKSEKKLDTILNRLTQDEKLEAVGMLANGVAHDFNNIFYIIIII